MFSSCIKDLEEEGIFETTTIKGCVLEDGTFKPIKATIRLKDKNSSVYEEKTTDADGNFAIDVTVKQMAKEYVLSIETDSLYGNIVKTFENISIGSQYFDIGKILFAQPSVPVIIIDETNNLTSTSIDILCSLIDSKNATITSKGVCFATHNNPTVNDQILSNAIDNKSFTCNLTDLQRNTTYYLKAFAQSSVGTGYSEQITFTTYDGLPVVVTKDITNISQTTASAGGNVTDDGDFTVEEKGVCYSMSINPTINNNHTSNGTGVGEFISNITNLQPNTTYYLRAFARNKVGVAYGEQKTFTTLSGLPTVTTEEVTNISSSSAVSGGNISSDGGFSITARGICISTSHNPTINNTHTTDGTGTGKFTSYLTDLSSNTTYYIRAYATNSAGTSYGKEISFTTK